MNSLTARIRSASGRRADLRPAAGNVPAGGAGMFPAHQVQITPGVGAGVTPLQPLIASDGAMFPATGPGQWDQLVTAGRML